MPPFNVSEKNKQQIDNINKKVFNEIGKINRLNSMRNFYCQFFDSPVAFLEDMISAQVGLYNNERNKFDTDEERFSQFYNQPVVYRLLDLYLAKQENKSVNT